jgi:hypothetical protein
MSSVDPGVDPVRARKGGAQMALAPRQTSHDLAGRLDAIGWGLLFLVTGVLLLVPDAPDGSWLAGVGAILLGVSAAKWLLGVGASWFMVILGGVGLVAGLGEMAGYDVPGLSLVLILCGAALIAAQAIGRREDSENVGIV